jgi:dipeptide/tripeptide permease
VTAGRATTTVGHGWALYAALTLLICGDGFFKTISAIVATLYPID